MSRKSHSGMAARWRASAPVFAALGDQTRLSLVAKLSGGKPRSISQLTKGTRLTRQAITKHLRVLERVAIVRSVRTGRQSLFEFDP
jgi:DNA-binding transcriptional ArsR family regulator